MLSLLYEMGKTCICWGIGIERGLDGDGDLGFSEMAMVYSWAERGVGLCWDLESWLFSFSAVGATIGERVCL